jgi:hypothetical protein
MLNQIVLAHFLNRSDDDDDDDDDEESDDSRANEHRFMSHQIELRHLLKGPFDGVGSLNLELKNVNRIFDVQEGIVPAQCSFRQAALRLLSSGSICV